MKTKTRTMIVTAWIASLILATLGFSYGESREPISEQLLDEMHRVNKRMLRYIIEDFQPHLSSRQKRIVNETDVSLLYTGDVYRVSAGRSPSGRRIIQISLGFIVAVETIINAYVIADVLGRDDATSYTWEFTRLMVENASRRARGLPKLIVPSYPEYANLDKREFDKLISPREFETRSILAKQNAMAFVLAHELAHHFYDHGTSNPDDEREADDFALELGVKARYLPILGAFPYLFFTSIEENSLGQPAATSHPISGCRAYRFLRTGLETLMQEPDFLDYLNEVPGTREKWTEVAQAFEDLVLEEFYPEGCDS